MNRLPNNPIILLSIVNTKLRDQYSCLCDLCEDLDENEDEVCSILCSAGYQYDKEINQFRKK